MEQSSRGHGRACQAGDAQYIYMKSEPQNGSFCIEDKQTEAWGFKLEAEEVRSAGGGRGVGGPTWEGGEPPQESTDRESGQPSCEVGVFISYELSGPSNKSSISWVWRSEVQNGCHWVKIKVSRSFWRLWGKSISWPFPASRSTCISWLMTPCSSFKAGRGAPPLFSGPPAPLLRGASW